MAAIIDQGPTAEQLGRDNEALRQRVKELEETLGAIHRGEVDSVIAMTPAGPRVFTLIDAATPYRTFVEEMQHGAATLACDGTILYCNHSLACLLRSPIERVVGAAWHTFVAEDSAAESEQLLARAALGKANAELSLRCAEGLAIPVSIVANRPTADLAGAICLVITDQTDRKQSETELRKIAWLLGGGEPAPKARERYVQPYGDLVPLNTSRLLADTVGAETLWELTHNTMDVLETSAAIYEKNGDYALGIFSSGWCRFMDQASRKLCDTSDNREALACGKWTCHESCWDTSRKSIETGRPVDVECKGGIRLYAVPVRCGDEIVGSMNFGYGDPPTDPEKLAELADRYHVTVDELRKAAGEYENRPAYLVNLAKERLNTAAGVVGAILEAKQAKAQVEELNRELELRVQQRTAELNSANKELEAFAYSVSHDLRSPLRAIDGFSQILLKDYMETLPEKPQHYLQMVCDNARQMGRLIDDLLRFSRSNRQSVQVQTVAPSGLVRQCVEELQVEREGRQVEIQIGELPQCWADANLLKQVWFNLLSNALKYTRKREFAKIEIGTETKNGETVYFIRDNGVGFDMQYANKLFGVFQRLHTAREYEGTGIGLALAQRIVRRHGGQIWADAKVDEGATFYFTLGRRPAHV